MVWKLDRGGCGVWINIRIYCLFFLKYNSEDNLVFFIDIYNKL